VLKCTYCSYLAEMVWPLQCTFTLSNSLNSPHISQLMFLQLNSCTVSIILSKTLKSSTLISDFDYRERFAECRSMISGWLKKQLKDSDENLLFHNPILIIINLCLTSIMPMLTPRLYLGMHMKKTNDFFHSSTFTQL
jgi:hypothetical protein